MSGARRARAFAARVGVLLLLCGWGGATVGCALSTPRYHGPVSDHFDGERFFNPGGQPAHGPGALLRWLSDREPGPWRDEAQAVPGPPPPRRVGQGRIRVTLVGHSTVLVQMDGLNILTDPIWSDRASPVAFAGPRRVRPPGLRFEDLPPIDLVLVSHGHYDHLDVPTLRRLAAAHGPQVVAPLGNTALLDRVGLPGSIELDWWQGVAVAPGVTVTAVPERHFSNRGAFDDGHSLWAGFVVAGPSGRVYFAGDTGYGPQFQEAAARLGAPRVALLPIGAFRPRWFMAPVHLDPAGAVQAARDLGAPTAVAIHTRTFRLGDDGEDEPQQELAKALAAEPGPAFWVLEFGEGREVP